MPLTPAHQALLATHAAHVAAFQELCLKTQSDPEYMEANDWADMVFQDMAMGFLLGRGVPVNDAYVLTIIGNIEPEYPTIKRGSHDR